MIIVGAGLAGLLAAHAWPQAEVFEAQLAPVAGHRALLRFRSDAVSALTGVPFKRVLVHKGLWSEGRFVAPTIALANAYARKVTGALLGDRSVWNLEPVERFIAPENFYEELVANVGARVHWATHFDFIEHARHGSPSNGVVSTAPLHVVMKALGMVVDQSFFRRAPIQVARYRLKQTDLHQTVYFPDACTKLYRASITGSLLIVECMVTENSQVWDDRPLECVIDAFGLSHADIDHDASDGAIGEQHYGKIVPLADGDRKNILLQLTQDFNVYSLGRFATWRNILLDDVVKDIAVLRRLMRAGMYEQHMFAKS